MAASIKMDELLVSWLGTDAVYENVMSLIEKKRHEPPAQEGADGEKPVDGDDNDASAAHSNDGTNATANTSTAAGGEADGDDEEGSSVAIPPFYSRPPPTSPGKKGGRPTSVTGAPYPRYRRQLSGPSAFADDQTWEGTGLKAAGSGPGGGPNDPSQGQQAGDGVLENMPTSPASSDIQTGTSAEGVSSPSSEPGLDTANPVGLEGAGSNDDGGGGGAGAGAGGPGGVGGNADNEPLPCIRDQVRAIYDELAVGADGQQQPESTKSSDDDAEEDTKDDDPAYTSRYLPVDAFVRITKEVCQFPTFFNAPLYRRILDLWHAKHNDAGADSVASRIPALDLNATETTDSADEANAAAGRGMEVVTYGMFKWYWTTEMEEYDASERFFRLIKQPDAEYIVRDDFLPYIQELLKDHPGLEFLSNHAEFQEKYAITVITRIYYSVNRCHDGRITSRQIRRSDLIAAFQLVDEEEDINKVTRYFSYEHFYVLYCRFWELDHDRDYRITREDLLKYGDHCLSHMIVDRIFDAAPRPFVESGPWTGAEEGGDEAAAAAGNDPASPPLSPASADVSDAPDKDQEGQDGGENKAKGTNREFLSYEDFIFFMLSEEDKANEISIRYWFSCIDVDGDGRLNNMEMRSFYAVQLHRMQCMGHEVVPFEDMLCQMIDMIKPECNDYLVPEDFLKPECAQVSGALFDALFNLNKYLMFEQRDPFMERQKREDEFDTDWDRFACIDYNRLAMEEEAREEEAMEIDWVTVDDEDEDGDEYNSMGLSSSEAPF